MPEPADENEPPPLVAPVSVNGHVGPSGTPPVSAPRRIVAPANPFDVSAAYAISMRLSLALGLVPGLGTGLLLVLVAGAGFPVSIAWPQLAQAHGQVQALGYTLLFILAVGLQLFPRFLGAPLLHVQRAPWGASLVALALVARLVGQPLGPGTGRVIVLVFSMLALPVGMLMAGSVFHGLSRRSVQPDSGPSAAWRRFVVVGGLALGTALVVYVWAGLGLAVGGVVVPQGTDEALIHLELAGFATCLVLSVGSRVFGRFLLLRTLSKLETWVPRLAVGWGVGLVLVAGGWLLDGSLGAWTRLLGGAIELAVLCTWLWLIGMYAPPTRESGTPYVTNPTRRWIRLAFVFLVFSLALDVGLFGREAVFGTAPLITELSAARHALAQGFLLPLMLSMASRLLPIYSADVLRHRARLELTIDLLLVGALLRVGAEAIGGYQAVAGLFVALGGGAGVAGFAVFAIGMWSALGRLPKSTRRAA
jgi:hypothetical protein